MIPYKTDEINDRHSIRDRQTTNVSPQFCGGFWQPFANHSAEHGVTLSSWEIGNVDAPSSKSDVLNCGSENLECSRDCPEYNPL